MALAVAEQQSGASNTAAITFTLGAGSAVGDLLVVIFGNDFGTASGLLTPTGTAAAIWTLQDTFDGGTNLNHTKVFTAPVTTAGAQTVVCACTDNTVEHGAAIWRIPNGAFDVASHANGTTSVSHVAPSLTPATNDEIYCVLWTNNDTGAGVFNYTYPGAPFVAATEQDLSPFETFGFGYEPITSGVATGTRTATASVTHPWTASAVLIKPASATAAPIPGPFPANPPGLFTAPWMMPNPWFGTGSDAPVDPTTDSVSPAATGADGLGPLTSATGVSTTTAAPSAADGLGPSANASGTATVTAVASAALGAAGTTTTATTTTQTALPSAAVASGSSAAATGAAAITTTATAADGGPGSSVLTAASSVASAPARGHGLPGSLTISAAATITTTATPADGSSGAVSTTGAASSSTLPSGVFASGLSASLTGAATVPGVPGPALGSGPLAVATATTVQAAQPSGATGAGPSTPTTGTAALSGSATGADGVGPTSSANGAATVTSAPRAAIASGPASTAASATTLATAIPSGALGVGGAISIAATSGQTTVQSGALGRAGTVTASGTATATTFASPALGRASVTTAFTTVTVASVAGRGHAGSGFVSIVVQLISRGAMSRVERSAGEMAHADRTPTGSMSGVNRTVSAPATATPASRSAGGMAPVERTNPKMNGTQNG
jgi:hypothetical protein